MNKQTEKREYFTQWIDKTQSIVTENAWNQSSPTSDRVASEDLLKEVTTELSSK